MMRKHYDRFFLFFKARKILVMINEFAVVWRMMKIFYISRNIPVSSLRLL